MFVYFVSMYAVFVVFWNSKEGLRHEKGRWMIWEMMKKLFKWAMNSTYLPPSCWLSTVGPDMNRVWKQCEHMI